MQPDDQLREFFEKLKQIFLDVCREKKDVHTLIDGTREKETQAQSIEMVTNWVEKNVRNADGKKSNVFKEQRELRGFDNELNRLWNRALQCYFDAEFNHFTSRMNIICHEDYVDEVKAALARKVVDITIPMLMELESPGDDFLLFVRQIVKNQDLSEVSKKIADTRKTPFDTEFSFFAIYGLLIEAWRANNQGDIPRAYSFLLDANHLIGNSEGARYVMKNLTDVARRIRGQDNSEKSRNQVNDYKKRVRELFIKMRPKGTDGKPQHWSSAAVASETIWKEISYGKHEDEMGSNNPPA